MLIFFHLYFETHQKAAYFIIILWLNFLELYDFVLIIYYYCQRNFFLGNICITFRYNLFIYHLISFITFNLFVINHFIQGSNFTSYFTKKIDFLINFYYLMFINISIITIKVDVNYIVIVTTVATVITIAIVIVAAAIIMFDY